MDELRHLLAEAVDNHRQKAWDLAVRVYEIYDDGLYWLSDKLEPYDYEGPNGRREEK